MSRSNKGSNEKKYGKKDNSTNKSFKAKKRALKERERE